MQRRSAQDGNVAGANPATRTDLEGFVLVLVLVVVVVLVLDLQDSITRTRTTRIKSGMSTGQASRACLLNSACLRASGASPRHSASLRREVRLGKPCARSSKRTVRLISGIALDQCRVPERYRTRAPPLSP